MTNPFLAKFYENPPKWALRMQMWLLRQRFVTYIAAIRHMVATGESVVMDRSVWSDSTFAVQNVKDGNISEVGYAYYCHVRAKMLAQLPTPHATVHLNASPLECHRRIHDMRKRDCESGIPLEYLAGLHECMVDFVKEMAAVGSKTFVYEWDSFGNTEQVVADIRNVMANNNSPVDLEQLRAFIYDDALLMAAMTPDYISEEAMDFDDYGNGATVDFSHIEADNAAEFSAREAGDQPDSPTQAKAAAAMAAQVDDASNTPLVHA